jgi:hypothetical protein
VTTIHRSLNPSRNTNIRRPLITRHKRQIHRLAFHVFALSIRHTNKPHQYNISASSAEPRSRSLERSNLGKGKTASAPAQLQYNSHMHKGPSSGRTKQRSVARQLCRAVSTLLTVDANLRTNRISAEVETNTQHTGAQSCPRPLPDQRTDDGIGREKAQPPQPWGGCGGWRRARWSCPIRA